jgi:hypothetical protein
VVQADAVALIGFPPRLADDVERLGELARGFRQDDCLFGRDGQGKLNGSLHELNLPSAALFFHVGRSPETEASIPPPHLMRRSPRREFMGRCIGRGWRGGGAREFRRPRLPQAKPVRSTLSPP